MRRRNFLRLAAGVAAANAVRWPAAWGADIPAIGLKGQQFMLRGSDIEALRAGLRGQVLLKGDAGYDGSRRIWNGAFDRFPALVARCAGPSDIVQAVNFAREHDLLLAVRGGGHSISGQSVCDGGMQIDLSPMDSVRVDPAARTARVEPGTALGHFDRETQFFGLATTAGTVSHTGVAGLTLGGGFGRLCRRYGLACDNLKSVDIIGADGQLRHASAKENHELFWGLRGGGGNFGVVSSFEFNLHQVNPVLYGGFIGFPASRARELLKFYAEFSAGASDDMHLDMSIATLPDGRRMVMIDAFHGGGTSRAEQELAPLRRLKPVMDEARPTPYVQLQQSFDVFAPWGSGVYEKAGFLRGISPALIDDVVALLERTTLPTAVINFVPHGGAMGRVPDTATAFAHRDAAYSLLLRSGWNPADKAAAEVASRWTIDSFAALERHTEGFYVNAIAADDTARRLQASYGPNYQRLVQLKTKYDPTNLFRRNANIPPRTAA
jgi:FAD/FMN-containing dehydrogenase